MSEREDVLAGLDRLETRLRHVLGVVEDPAASPDVLRDAVDAWAAEELDAARVVRAFADASPIERSAARARLARLADLDALTRASCQQALAHTALSLERTRALRAQLDTVDDRETSGLSLDCTH